MLRSSVVALLTLAGLALATPASAEPSRTIDVPSFTAVRAENYLKVNIVVGGQQAVSIASSSDANLDDIRWSVFNDELHVWSDSDLWDALSFRDQEVTVSISVPELHGIAAASLARVKASGLAGDNVRIEAASTAIVAVEGIKATRVSVLAESTGQLFLSGDCQTVDARVASAAIVDARGLKCVDADLVAASASQATFYATGLVTADASSAARISLAGNPRHVDDEEASAGEITVIH